MSADLTLESVPLDALLLDLANARKLIGRAP